MQPCRQQRLRGDSLQANWRRQPTDRDDIADRFFGVSEKTDKWRLSQCD